MVSTHSNKKTALFFHHSGASSSQIDYIMSSDINLLNEYKIHKKHATNLSSHTVVTCSLSVDTQYSAIAKKCDSIWKYDWEKINKEKYQESLQLGINSYDELYAKPENKIEFLTSLIKHSSDSHIPLKIIKLKGPKWKASPQASILLKKEQASIQGVGQRR